MLRKLLFAGIFLILLSILLIIVLGVMLGEFYRIRTLASVVFSLGVAFAISSRRITVDLRKSTEAVFRLVVFVTTFTVTFFLLEVLFI